MFALSGYSYLLDRYPPEWEGAVQGIKSALDARMFTAMTDIKAEAVDTSEFFFLSRAETCVVVPRRFTNFVIKTSMQKADDLFHLHFTNRWSGIDFNTSNEEGGVCTSFWDLAGRVAVASRLRAVVQEYGLDRIVIPKKALLSFPDSVAKGHYFVLAERVAASLAGVRTGLAVARMGSEDQRELGRQLCLFCKHAGILDFLKHNFYVHEGKLTFFDTQPMSLAWASVICRSPAIKIERLNLVNVRKQLSYFDPIVTQLDGELEQLPKQIDLRYWTMPALVSLFMIYLFFFGIKRASDHISEI